MLHALDAVEGSVRLDRHQPDTGIPLTEEPADADEGAGRAQASDQMGDAAAGLFPNLRARRLEVSPPVRLVVVLVQVPKLARFGFDEGLGGLLSSVRPLGRRRQDEVGSIRGEHPMTRLRDISRDAQGRAVSFRRGEHCDDAKGVHAVADCGPGPSAPITRFPVRSWTVLTMSLYKARSSSSERLQMNRVL